MECNCRWWIGITGEVQPTVASQWRARWFWVVSNAIQHLNCISACSWKSNLHMQMPQIIWVALKTDSIDLNAMQVDRKTRYDMMICQRQISYLMQKKMSRNYLLNIIVDQLQAIWTWKNKNEEEKFSEDSPNGAFSESKNPSRFPMQTCIPAVLASRATVGQKPGGFWSSIFRPHRYQTCPIHEYMSQICSHYIPGRVGIRS